MYTDRDIVVTGTVDSDRRRVSLVDVILRASSDVTLQVVRVGPAIKVLPVRIVTGDK